MESSLKQTTNIQSKIIKQLEAAPEARKIGWTEFEKQMLIKYYPIKDSAAIGKILGKNKTTVNNMASKMGLKKNGRC